MDMPIYPSWEEGAGWMWIARICNARSALHKAEYGTGRIMMCRI
jgi:hypothetical protein